jgi:hypothetical protein
MIQTVHMWDKMQLPYAVTVYDPYRNYSATYMLSAEFLYVTCGNYSCKIRGTDRMG